MNNVTTIIPSIQWSELTRNVLVRVLQQKLPKYCTHTVYLVLSGVPLRLGSQIHSFVDTIPNISHSDISFKLFLSPFLLNGSEARNIGLKYAYSASSQFIAFVDSDDFVHEYKLMRQIQYLSDSSSADFCATLKKNVLNDITFPHDNNTALPPSCQTSFSPITLTLSPLTSTILRHKLPHMSSFVFRAEALRSFLFDSKLTRFQDLDMLLYLSSMYKSIAVIPETLVYINKSPSLEKARKQSLRLSLYLLQKHSHRLPFYIYPLFILKYVLYPRVRYGLGF